MNTTPPQFGDGDPAANATDMVTLWGMMTMDTNSDYVFLPNNHAYSMLVTSSNIQIFDAADHHQIATIPNHREPARAAQSGSWPSWLALVAILVAAFVWSRRGRA